MKILFDQGVPVPLSTYLTDHTVSTAYESGWATLKNGELLDAAESGGFAMFMTTDQSLEYQQNLVGRQIAIIVLPTTAWPTIQDHVPEVLDAVSGISPGELRRVEFLTDSDD